jgi:hypothetical protein
MPTLPACSEKIKSISAGTRPYRASTPGAFADSLATFSSSVGKSGGRVFAPARPRRFPGELELRAIELGSDELLNQASWIFRARPRTLRNIRRKYRRFCLLLFRKIESAG